MMHLKVTVALTAAFALLPQCLSSEEDGPFAPAPAPSPPLECSEVRNAFDARGIRVDWSAIPKGPMNGKLVGSQTFSCQCRQGLGYSQSCPLLFRFIK